MITVSLTLLDKIKEFVMTTMALQLLTTCVRMTYTYAHVNFCQKTDDVLYAIFVLPKRRMTFIYANIAFFSFVVSLTQLFVLARNLCSRVLFRSFIRSLVK